MSKALDVYLHHHLAGHLTQDKSGQLGFEYTERWLANPTAMPLSLSLPLRKDPFKQRECTGFFGGILPEESNRELIAKNLGISPRNDFSLLEQIGGECAGAVTFMPAGEPLPKREDEYRKLSDSQLAEVLKELPRRPLLAGEDGVRLSLAGAQSKLAVKVVGDTVSIPLNGAFSTHILKPANPHFEELVFNELFCLQLAQAIGLIAAKAEARTVEGIDYLLVERYDRKQRIMPSGTKACMRVHQEDFCQALGIPSKNKYQGEGGPSLKQCFALIREASSLPAVDLQRLLDAAIYNYLIGNNDAHGKNFSFMFEEGAFATGNLTKFTPLYDLVCTAIYPELSAKMAMKIGDEYLFDKITPSHFEKLAEEANLAKPLVKKRVPELAATILQKLKGMATQRPLVKNMTELIQTRCESALKEFK